MAKLIVNPTSTNRREIPLTHAFLSIGRDPSNDLVLPDAMVSRRHAVVEHRASQYVLRDCNSSNGSLVNGDRISERALRDGDLVAIGSARLLFREEIEVESAAGKVVHHPSAPRLVCPACSADFRRGDLFCRQCGGALGTGPSTAVCGSCGTVVSLPAVFCNSCGTRLPRDEPPADENAPAVMAPATPSQDAPHPRPQGRVAAPERIAARPPSPLDITTEEAPLVLEPLPAEPPPRPVQAPSRPPAPAAGQPRPQLRPAAPAPRPPLARAPRGFEALPRPAASSASMEAGFGLRLVAFVLDSAIVGLIQGLVLLPAVLYWWSREIPRMASEAVSLPLVLSVALVPLALLAGAAYHVLFWGVRGATPGKSLLGLAVQTRDGDEPIGLARASVRLFGYCVSGALLGVGFLMIATGEGGLHDRIAGTRVVRRERS
jgi:uncharacterized RDD family membrane protein YckC